MQKEVRWKLIMLSILGVFLLNFPLIQLFSRQQLIAGVPLIYGYILVVWLVFIVILYRIVDRPTKAEKADRPKQ